MPEGYRALPDLEFARIGDRPLLLDLYLPEGRDGLLPTIVWIHGGAWQRGSRTASPVLPAIRQELTGRGYALAAISYRLSQEAIFPAQIHDCKAAIRWLRANAGRYDLDPDRIGAMGASAGGHLAALLGTSGGVDELEGASGNTDYSSRVQAVCDWFGPSDFLQMDANALHGSTLIHDAPDSPEAQLLGGPIQGMKEAAARANPIIYITKDNPPFLIIHGDKDPTVPFHQSQLLYDALQRAGVDAIFQPIPGAGHGGPEFTEPDVLREVGAFFDRTLAPRSALAF